MSPEDCPTMGGGRCGRQVSNRHSSSQCIDTPGQRSLVCLPGLVACLLRCIVSQCEAEILCRGEGWLQLSLS